MNNCDCCLVRYTDSDSYIKTNINSAWCCLIFLHLFFFFFVETVSIVRAWIGRICVCVVLCVCVRSYEVNCGGWRSCCCRPLSFNGPIIISAFIISYAGAIVNVKHFALDVCQDCVKWSAAVTWSMLLCAMCGWGFEEVRSPIAQWPRLITRKTRSEATAMCAIVCVYVCCVMCVMMKQPTC